MISLQLTYFPTAMMVFCIFMVASLSRPSVRKQETAFVLSVPRHAEVNVQCQRYSCRCTPVINSKIVGDTLAGGYSVTGNEENPSHCLQIL